MSRAAEKLFDDQLDRIVWIKNRAGTSSMAGFMLILVFALTLVYLAPHREGFSTDFSLELPGIEFVTDDAAAEKIKQRLAEADDFFAIAESHFGQSPPDYIKAEMAYSTAADNGSLLAAYKLGYLYYNGEGVAQNDVLAFEYFLRATQAPLAFQPHSLKLTTQFLAESFNNLGLMYQGGLGTRKNIEKARAMYQKGAEFGSANARQNLARLTRSGAQFERKSLLRPDYE